MSKANIREPRGLSLHVKCSQKERERWGAKARSHGLSLSDYLREFLEESRSSRRRPAPPIDPMLMAQIGRAGNNLNQIAKAVNGTLRHGDEIDTLAIHAELVCIERALQSFQREHSK
ncbi:plasmid mobilization protein [Sulfitobacter geojensis]|uniref:plasmid mobilization protein n=1 Tax=Sulfitobacter geojensis TaxID=1342299 RepID=UPI003CD0D57A